MKNDQKEPDAYELLNAPQNAVHIRDDAASELWPVGTRTCMSADEAEAGYRTSDEDEHGDGDLTPPPRRRLPTWMPFSDFKEMFYFFVILINIIPVVLLVLYAPRISASLGANACLPNGNFVFPSTTSVWNPKYVFTITVLTGNGLQDKWTYEHVKIIVGNGATPHMRSSLNITRTFSGTWSWVGAGNSSSSTSPTTSSPCR